MKILRVAFSVALLLSGARLAPAFAQEAAPAPPDVLAAASAFDKAFRAGDQVAVSGLLADDCLSTGAAGRVETKKQLLSDYEPMAEQIIGGQFKFDTFARSNVQSRDYGNVVVLIGALDLLSHIQGVPSSDMQPVHYRFTQVWTKSTTGWKLSAVQNTRISSSGGSTQPLP